MHYECSMAPGRASRENVRGKIKKVLDDEIRKKQQTILKSPHRKEKLELFNWLQVKTLLLLLLGRTRIVLLRNSLSACVVNLKFSEQVSKSEPRRIAMPISCPKGFNSYELYIVHHGG